MSQFGGDEFQDLNIATEVTKVKGLMPFNVTWVDQWTNGDGEITQKYASRRFNSNLLIRLTRP